MDDVNGDWARGYRAGCEAGEKRAQAQIDRLQEELKGQMRLLQEDLKRQMRLNADLHKGVCSSYAEYKADREKEVRDLTALAEASEKRAERAEALLVECEKALESGMMGERRERLLARLAEAREARNG